MEPVTSHSRLCRGQSRCLFQVPLVVELSVQLEVQETEEKGEDGEGQIEVEEERGELKERRTCTWMTSRDSELEPRGACDPTSKSVTRCALAFMLR